VRWENLEVEREEGTRLPGFREPATVRTFDAPEAMGINFYEVHARSALNHVPKQSRMPFRWTINPYRGCTHACSYCFARPSHTYLDFNAREDFERQIVVKVNAPELLRAELAKRSWKGEHVALGTNTDPYQWVEGRYRLMEGIWEAMRDVANPCSILTKSPLLLRDIDVMKELNEQTEFSAALSIPTLEEDAWRRTEPHTPHPCKRMEAVAQLSGAGIPTSVLIGPIIPGVNDAPEQIAKILELAGEAGASNVIGIPLHLRGEVKEIWFDWLREHRPDLIPRYEALYARGAYMRKAESERLRTMVKAPPGGWRGPRRPTRGTRAAPRPTGDDRRPQADEPAQASLF
jgi:DNA repair photolyase